MQALRSVVRARGLLRHMKGVRHTAGIWSNTHTRRLNCLELSRAFSTARAQIKQEEEHSEEEDQEFREGFGQKLTYDIKNPDKAEKQMLYKLVPYKRGQRSFTVSWLRDQLELDEQEHQQVLHLYNLKADGGVNLEEARAICWYFNHELVTEEICSIPAEPRPPIVTIMGHVDHGKTTLLDSYRNSALAEAEVGGITQKVGGFCVQTPFGQVTFIDTPGHSLFTNMRKTGAGCTDLVILVVSAVEGVQNQTHEVLSIIEDSKIPVMIAINKIDSPKADPEAVEDQLFNMGVQIEPRGGNIPVVHISALNKINTNMLLELLLFEADRLGISSIMSKPGQGVVLEGKQIDMKNCSLILRQGRVRRGDWLVAQDTYCKVVKITDDLGKVLEVASAGMAVQIHGFKTLPKANEKLVVVENEKEAKEYMKVSEYFRTLANARTIRNETVSGTKIKFDSGRERRKFHSGNKAMIEQIYLKKLDQLQEKRDLLVAKSKDTTELDQTIRDTQQALEKIQKGDKSGKKLMIKADDLGTLDTMVSHAMNIKDSFGKRNFEIVKAEIGPITEADLIESLEFETIIYTMDATYPEDLESTIKSEGIDVRTFKIIYQFLDDLRLLNESLNENYSGLDIHGRAEIKEVFDIKAGGNSKVLDSPQRPSEPTDSPSKKVSSTRTVCTESCETTPSSLTT